MDKPEITIKDLSTRKPNYTEEQIADRLALAMELLKVKARDLRLYNIIKSLYEAEQEYEMDET